MMLDRPEMIEANLVSQFRLRHDLLVAVTLDSVVVRFTNLDFIHEPELHSRVLQMRADRHLRSDAYPLSYLMRTLWATINRECRNVNGVLGRHSDSLPPDIVCGCLDFSV